MHAFGHQLKVASLQKLLNYLQSKWNLVLYLKGHPPSEDLRYGEEDTISRSTLIFAARKGLLWIYTLYITPDVPKKLALPEKKLKQGDSNQCQTPG